MSNYQQKIRFSKCRVVKRLASNRLIISHKMFFITPHGSHRNKQPICFQVPQTMSLLGISTWWCVASLFNSMRHFSTRAYVLLFYEIFVPETDGWDVLPKDGQFEIRIHRTMLLNVVKYFAMAEQTRRMLLDLDCAVWVGIPTTVRNWDGFRLWDMRVA